MFKMSNFGEELNQFDISDKTRKIITIEQEIVKEKSDFNMIFNEIEFINWLLFFDLGMSLWLGIDTVDLLGEGSVRPNELRSRDMISRLKMLGTSL